MKEYKKMGISTSSSVEKIRKADQQRKNTVFSNEVLAALPRTTGDIAVAAISLILDGTETSWPRTLSPTDISVIEDLAKKHSITLPF